MAKTKSKYNRTELTKRLRFALVGIFAFIFLGVISINFFGPQIGAMFGFISVNRNSEGPKAKAALSTPSFMEVPDAVNEKVITVQGYAKEGENVKLYVNGPSVGEVLVGGDGKFIFENVELIDGRNTIFAKTVNSKGDESNKSETHVVIVDKEKPTIEVERPTDGDVVKNLNERVFIKGKVSEKATIRINDRLAVQKPNLEFEFLLGVNEGDVVITIEATDEAGNTEVEKIGIKYEKESD